MCLFSVTSCSDETEKNDDAKTTQNSDAETVAKSEKETVTEKEEKSSNIEITKESGEKKYCYIRKLIEENGDYYIVTDFIQFLYGDEAVEVAKKRGFAEYDIDENGDTIFSVPNDYIILNDNPKLRTFKLSKDVYIRLIDWESERLDIKENCQPTEMNLNEEYSSPYYLTYTNGVVDSIWEEYTP